MNLSVQDDYPIGTAWGACALTRAAQRDIIVDTADGPVRRKERIVTTGIDDEFDRGQWCISETAVRFLAHEFGLVDDWKVDTISRDNADLRLRLVSLSAALGNANAEIRRLNDLDRPDVEKVYLDLEGNEHADALAARERTAQVLGLRPSVIIEATRTAVPIVALEGQPA